MKIVKTLLALVALLPVVAGAQINHRQYEQHRRIESGVHRGTLTRREAAGLRAREAALRARERRDRRSHGRLTTAERIRLARAQDRLSHRIDRQKHDRQHRGF